MLRAAREGPTRRARGREWPLDGIFVGVGTVRVLRELCRTGWRERGIRAWDLAQWCGVTPQGAARALERLERRGLVRRVLPARPGRAATWRLDSDHPLSGPIRYLFAQERHHEGAVTRRTSGHPPDD